MIYIVTGTPGTGKTTFAKKLSEEKGFEYIDGNEVIEKYKLSQGTDEEGSSLVDEVKFASACKEIIQKLESENKNAIIDSHLSLYIDSEFVDKCYVTECDVKELEKRLKKRKYSKQKIRDNLDAEIFKVCENDAKERKHKVEVINTSSK